MATKLNLFARRSFCGRLKSHLFKKTKGLKEILYKLQNFHLKSALEKQFLLVFACLLSICFSAKAQLNARFVADNSGGCSPFTVHFTNTSYASSKAIYKWDFGNGNTSTLKDPGAVFLESKKYTVTLTVTDGNQTSSS